MASVKTITNKLITLRVDANGGALVDFRLVGESINPLGFAFTAEQMPDNNKNGAVFQGHFACIGRWGEPSIGEIKAGVPNHGAFANIPWEFSDTAADGTIRMTSHSEIEGLSVERLIRMEANRSLFYVEETISNTHVLGRPFNIVQHPTIAFPFLNKSTVVDCNGKEGFSQKRYKNPEASCFIWPKCLLDEKATIDLRNPQIAENGVFSYVVDRESPYGWLTCYSATHNTILGYIWERANFPWIHLWVFWENEQLKYRGLEFGTAGIHQPFKELLQTPRIFDTATSAYIDAGEQQYFSYRSFMTKAREGFGGVSNVTLKGETVCIQSKSTGENLYC